MDEPIQYLAPAQVDRLSLREARKVFSDTFAQFYDPAPFDSLLNEVYGPGGIMERDLGDPAIHWLVAAKGEKPIGYAKLSQHVAPASNPKPGAIELRQIYVLHTWHGEGIAGCLIEWALNTALRGFPRVISDGVRLQRTGKAFLYSLWLCRGWPLHFYA